ncbi:MAG: FAD-dependent oxidoreductase [Candidatus Woesearchaeota archaeon]
MKGIRSYLVKLLERKEIAEKTYILTFEKPAGFSYLAGQFVIISLIGEQKVDEKGASRAFSLASAPYEEKLMIAVRGGESAFKQALLTASIGAQFGLEGPFGSLILDKSKRPVVLIAGGIGIAPFRSIILQAVHEGLEREITLIYSEKRPEDAVFLEELSKIKVPKFKLVVTMTRAGQSSKKWQGRVGRINEKLLKECIPAIEEALYYVVGLPEMVRSVKALLLALGVKAENIKEEIFSGYQKKRESSL